MGQRPDTDVALAPGQRPPRQNALTVVVAKALDEFEQMAKKASSRS